VLPEGGIRSEARHEGKVAMCSTNQGGAHALDKSGKKAGAVDTLSSGWRRGNGGKKVREVECCNG